MTEVEWSQADGYLLQGFAYHDGTILDFRYRTVSDGGSGRRDLVLDVASVQGEVVRLHFATVEVLRVAELWEASIINSFHVARLSAPIVMQSPFEEFWRQIQWAGADARKETDVRKLVNRLGDHLAVVLFGSYGCAFSLICERLHVSKAPSVTGVKV